MWFFFHKVFVSTYFLGFYQHVSDLFKLRSSFKNTFTLNKFAVGFGGVAARNSDWSGIYDAKKNDEMFEDSNQWTARISAFLQSYSSKPGDVFKLWSQVRFERTSRILETSWPFSIFPFLAINLRQFSTRNSLLDSCF